MTAHKILIGTAVVFFLFFAAVQWRGVPSGRGTPLAAGLGLAAAALLGGYFWWLRRK